MNVVLFSLLFFGPCLGYNIEEIHLKSDFSGPCSNQSSPDLSRRNCRYGKCEIVNDGKDFVCHCDSQITGRKCDLPAIFAIPNDVCSSNPCWGDSLCVVLVNDQTRFECVCSEQWTGKFCQLKKSIQEIKPSSRLLSGQQEYTINKPKCSYDTCQLGRCVNDYCQCALPAVGKNCDRIDECLVLKCINGRCVTGKGCICDPGYYGITCEGVSKNVSNKALPAKVIDNPQSYCLNGGLFIDNTCICLNQFTGDRCELPPIIQIRDTTIQSTTYSTTKESQVIVIPTAITTTQQSNFSAEVRQFGSLRMNNSFNNLSFNNSKQLEKIGEKFEFFLKILSLFTPNEKAKNTDEYMHWPWFECFPSQAQVYILVNNNIKQIPISELKVNDRVAIEIQNEGFEFSQVVNFLHKVDELDAKFYRLYFELLNGTDKSLTITKRHLIYLPRNERYVPVNQLKIGDYLEYNDLSTRTKINVKITKIQKDFFIKNSGIYSPLTKKGKILVNNIHTSCYSIVKSHYLAQFAYSLLNYFQLNSNYYNIFTQYLYKLVSLLSLEKFLFQMY